MQRGATQIQRLVSRLFPRQGEEESKAVYDGLSIASFVLGALSVSAVFFSAIWIWLSLLIFLGPVAVALGVVAIARKRRTGKKGLGLAIAGVILGLLGCLGSVVVLAIALNL